MKFKIGDTVSWLDSDKIRFYGIILSPASQASRDWEVQMDNNFIRKYSNYSSTGKYNWNERDLTFKGSPRTKQQLVEEKIKILWNNSNYVKENPTHAY